VVYIGSIEGAESSRWRTSSQKLARVPAAGELEEVIAKQQTVGQQKGLLSFLVKEARVTVRVQNLYAAIIRAGYMCVITSKPRD
jgi:hypothetical protein